ncbi:unnamed protein product (macronuclear) [Paramecium tetraurelia]|uniref:Serine aminopeptidase S33 domain-containing protein n=1 Tax=Paramecium tetraurelia TaxID=5888 RepID=A0DG79_PARTE|nr:uncharacterized protein GSPATT00002175001 [Paramecium tetraurelia]CAK82046.1 unnamed protein product [Paramecium tetraurelia]|eukprot:XP_001449443.1 hypothetical protein (macronuclear) [Paramecium tetraurelia strain d4-2]
MNQNFEGSQAEVLHPTTHMQIQAVQHEKIISGFDHDPDKFLGEFQFNSHLLTRQYLLGDGTQLRLYFTKVTPQNVQIKASLAIIHGFGEHSGRFLHLADFYAKAGFEVYMIDLRGFGYSGGARGCATQQQLLLDVKVLIQQVNPSLPLFLYGHSMGGLVVLAFTLLNPAIQIAGVIATSPLLGFPTDRKLDWLKLNFVTTAGKKLEDMVVNSMVNPTALTKNNNQLKHSFGDRLMIPFCGLNMAASILSQVKMMKSYSHLFNKPLLILHGKQDAVTNYHDSVYFFESCKSQEKALKLFENGYHELQHDEECDELMSITLDWLQRRLDNAKILGNVPTVVNVHPLKRKSNRKWKLILVFLIAAYFIVSIKYKDLAQGSQLKKLIIPLLLFKK